MWKLFWNGLLDIFDICLTKFVLILCFTPCEKSSRILLFFWESRFAASSVFITSSERVNLKSWNFQIHMKSQPNCMGRSEEILTDNGVYVTSHGVQENWAVIQLISQARKYRKRVQILDKKFFYIFLELYPSR